MLTPMSLIAIGLGLAYVVSLRWTRDRVLTAIVVLAYLIRSGLALALYALSSWRVPFFHDLQLGDGFWAFAPDSVYYHEYAKAAVVALRAHLELPYAYGSPDYPLMVAGLYQVTGPHPLVPISVNIWLASLTVLLAYVLARRLWTIDGARVAAALVAFWPSSILWSTQVLKDTIEIFFIVAFLYTFSRLADRLDVARREEALRMVALAAAAFLTLAGAYVLRFYIGLALLISSLTVLAIATASDGWRKRYARATAGVGLAISLICAIWVGTWISSEGVAKPVDPAGTSRRLAAHMVSIGDLDGALWQLQTALLQEKDAPSDRAERERRVRPELKRLISANGDLGLDTRDEPTPPDAESAGEAEPARSPAFLEEMFGLVSLSQLQATRAGYFQDARSLIADPNESVDTAGAFIRLAPQAFANALFSPHPWTRFETAGSTGIFRRVAIIEVLFIPLLLYFSATGVRSLFRRQWQLGLLLALYSVIVTAALGYTIPVVGVLFRLRLAVLVPLCILAGGGHLPVYVARLCDRNGRPA